MPRAVNSVKTVVLCLSPRKRGQAGVLPLSAQMASSERLRAPSLFCRGLSIPRKPNCSHLLGSRSASPASPGPLLTSLWAQQQPPGGPAEAQRPPKGQSKCTGKRSMDERGESRHFKIKQYNLEKKKSTP